MTIQVIGTLVTDGTVLSLGLAAGFEKLPLERQRDILRFCARFIDATVADMDEEITALKDGAKATENYNPTDNAMVEGFDYENEGEAA